MAYIMYDNSKRTEDKLTGVIPQHYTAYQIFKSARFLAGLFLVILLIIIGIRFVDNPLLNQFSGSQMYNIVVLGVAAICSLLGLFMLLIHIIFLRKPGFDFWVFEFAQKHLGTEVIYYNSKCLYIQYNRASTKEVNKEEFVQDMSAQSEHYSYYYNFKDDTYIDLGVIRVTPEKKSPIPDRASFNPADDEFFNFVPVGLTVNNATKSISPIGWYINDNNVSDIAIKTAPSVSFLIAGGPLSLDTIIPTTKGYKTMETIEVGDEVFDINNNATKVIKVEDINFNPTKIYKLIFSKKGETISVVSDNIHRFPKIIDDRIYLSTAEELEIDDVIIDSGKYYEKDYIGWKLTDKFAVKNEPVRCIAVNSEFHLFLITDEMNKNWKGGKSYPYKAILTKNTGCHIAGEEILMADGSIKKVEDIVVGDFIMGPDKKPREVLELHRGQDEMYEIESEDGNKHIVNGGHILPLYDIETKEILNMDVRTYLFMNDEFKSKMRIMKI